MIKKKNNVQSKRNKQVKKRKRIIKSSKSKLFKSKQKVRRSKHKTKTTKRKIGRSLKKYYKEHPRRTKKIGNKLSDIKQSSIVEGRLNQIIMKYKIGKQKFEVSVIIRHKKSLKSKIRLLNKYNRYETRKSKLKILSINRYLVKKRKKKK